VKTIIALLLLTLIACNKRKISGSVNTDASGIAYYYIDDGSMCGSVHGTWTDPTVGWLAERPGGYRRFFHKYQAVSWVEEKCMPLGGSIRD